MLSTPREEELVAHETQFRRKTGDPSPKISGNLCWATIPEIMSSYEAIPESSEVEFSHFEGAVSAFDTTGGSKDDHQPDEDKSSTFLEMVFSFYLPLAAVWIRRSLFGITMLVRTLILGHLFRLAAGNLTDWLSETTPTWLQPLLYPVAAATSGKSDPKAWPPPALTALGLLTIGALVIHPDGFTWVMIGKARNAIMSFLRSFSECWQVVITDYGVIPTIIASITLATLIFLMFAMLRSVSSRKPKIVPAQEKKKKKRKGQNRHRGSTGKTKAHIPSAPPLPATSSVQSSDVSRAANKKINLEQSPVLKLTSPGSPIKGNPEIQSISQSTAASTESISRHSSPTIIDSTLPAIDATRSLNDLPGSNAIRTLDSTTQAKSLEKDLRGRGRVPSVSTLDTTALSDDQSCGSTSIRSFPSVSVASSKSSQVVEQTLSPVSCTTASAGSPGGNKTKANTSSTQRRDKRFGRNQKSKASNMVKGNDGPSRWDVLKPSKNQNQPHPPAEQALVNPPSSTPNRDVHGHTNRHHQQSQSHRSNGRRGGRGSNNGTKKGRSGSKALVSTSPNKELTPDRNITGNSNGRKPTPQSNRPSSRTPISPPHLSRKGEKGSSSTSTLLSQVSPSPPPGWNPIQSANNGSTNAQASFTLPARTTQADSHNNKTSSIFYSSNVSPPRETFAWGLSPDHRKRDLEISTFSVSKVAANCRHGDSFVPSPVRIGTVQGLPCTPGGSFDYRAPCLGSGKVKENPFAPDSTVSTNFCGSNEELDKQIEADLQELGGQMAGSILDF